MVSDPAQVSQQIDRLRQVFLAGVKALRDARNAPKRIIHNPQTGLIEGAQRVKQVANHNADTQQI